MSAYILNLNGLVPANAVMDQTTLAGGADAQPQRLHRRRPAGRQGRALHDELQVACAQSGESATAARRSHDRRRRAAVLQGELARGATPLFRCETTTDDGSERARWLKNGLAHHAEWHGTCL